MYKVSFVYHQSEQFSIFLDDNSWIMYGGYTGKHIKVVSGKQKQFWLQPRQKHFLFPSSKHFVSATYVFRSAKLGNICLHLAELRNTHCWGNIVAERQIFPSLEARKTYVAETNFAARKQLNVFNLRTFALIVSAHPYCARRFKCHVMHRASAKY